MFVSLGPIINGIAGRVAPFVEIESCVVFTPVVMNFAQSEESPCRFRPIRPLVRGGGFQALDFPIVEGVVHILRQGQQHRHHMGIGRQRPRICEAPVVLQDRNMNAQGVGIVGYEGQNTLAGRCRFGAMASIAQKARFVDHDVDVTGSKFGRGPGVRQRGVLIAPVGIKAGQVDVRIHEFGLQGQGLFVGLDCGQVTLRLAQRNAQTEVEACLARI